MKTDRSEVSRPILFGGDHEYSNWIEGVPNSGMRAARLLLKELGGATNRCRGWVPQTESGRRWGNFCCYIDLSHLEIALPETTSPFDYVLYSAAGESMLRKSLRRLNVVRERNDNPLVHVLATNTDGQNSWGDHVNFGIDPVLYERLFSKSLHLSLYLASYKASSIIITGQGCVTPEGEWLLSQRAGFFSQLFSEITTANRGLINTRDEPLADGSVVRRLHDIFHDTNLCEWAKFLKVGIPGLILDRMSRDPQPCDPGLILENPVASLQKWNANPDSRECLIDGRRVTALEHQLLFAESTANYVEGECFDSRLCSWGEKVLAMWRETLEKMAGGDDLWLQRRIDNRLKYSICERALSTYPGLDWQSAEVRVLADKYASLGDDGIFGALQNDVATERLLEDEQVKRAVSSPPADTRAWTRFHLLRVGEDGLESADWDSLRFRSSQEGRSGWCYQTTQICLDDPYSHTQQDYPGLVGCESLDEALNYLMDKQN